MGTQNMAGYSNEDCLTTAKEHQCLLESQNIQMGSIALLNLQRVKPSKQSNVTKSISQQHVDRMSQLKMSQIGNPDKAHEDEEFELNIRLKKTIDKLKKHKLKMTHI